MLARILFYIDRKRKLKKLSQPFAQLKQQEATTQKRFQFNQQDSVPYLADSTTETHFDRHYIYHPAWAARILKKLNPAIHIDISSTLHFCSIVSAFMPVQFYDYRPAKLILSDLETSSQDLIKLSFVDNTIQSLSCMHTVEHIGLGRYGDAIDYDGDEKAMKELARVLMPNGNLLFVTPVGSTAKIIFNAHRIYSKELIIKTFLKYGLILKEFTLIPENGADGGLVTNPTDELLSRQVYACGCFWFTK